MIPMPSRGYTCGQTYHEYTYSVALDYCIDEMCSGHGACDGSVCSCDAGWVGRFCDQGQD